MLKCVGAVAEKRMSRRFFNSKFYKMKKLLVALMILFSTGLQAQDVTGTWNNPNIYKAELFQDGQNVYGIYNVGNFKHFLSGRLTGNQLQAQVVRIDVNNNCRTTLAFSYTLNGSTLSGGWTTNGGCDLSAGRGDESMTKTTTSPRPLNPFGGSAFTPANDVTGSWSWEDDWFQDSNNNVYYIANGNGYKQFFQGTRSGNVIRGQLIRYNPSGCRMILNQTFTQTDANTMQYSWTAVGDCDVSNGQMENGTITRKRLVDITNTDIDIFRTKVATVYPNPNFGGTSNGILRVSRNTLSQLGMPSVGSIKVAWGYKAIVTYESADKKGAINTNQMEIVGDRETLPTISGSGASAGRSRVTAIEIVAYTPLSGFVDMHTHPAAQLGFGKELFHGENDGNIASALGNCNCKHNYIQKIGFFEPSGYCPQQNFFRNKLVDETDKKYEIPAHIKGGGYPDFANWPNNRSVLHQQMWWEWIKRAKDGGLKVMVALAVNSHILADAAETSGTYDDEQAIEEQIEAIKQLASNHSSDFEIALTASDMRRIVQSGRLAIILGTETDNIGNFYAPAYPKSSRVPYNSSPRNEDVAREIDKLWNMGIRYIFPVHITDNVFGGTAIYETSFNAANKYNTGRVFNAELVNTSETGIGFKLGNQENFSNWDNVNDVGSGIEYLFAGIYDEFSNLFGTFGINANILPNHIMPNVRGNYPQYPDTSTIAGRGYRNTLDLTRLGTFAITYMMQKGMMIDIDHMSEKTVTSTLNLATRFNYPVNSGHNGLRGTNGSENQRTVPQLTTIKNLGGLFGLGHGGEASKFVMYYREALQIMDYKQLCIGTDANGLYLLPDKPVDAAKVEDNYRNGSLTMSQTGTKPWDYDKMGMAHYGLFPEFIQSLTNAGMTANEKRIFFSSAEYFAQMWEKCERQRANIR